MSKPWPPTLSSWPATRPAHASSWINWPICRTRTATRGGAVTTVVGSGGESLEIETTSLATLAWLRDPSYAAHVEAGIRYLADSCKAGRYGSTQSHRPRALRDHRL